MSLPFSSSSLEIMPSELPSLVSRHRSGTDLTELPGNCYATMLGESEFLPLKPPGLGEGVEVSQAHRGGLLPLLKRRPWQWSKVYQRSNHQKLRRFGKLYKIDEHGASA